MEQNERTRELPQASRGHDPAGGRGSRRRAPSHPCQLWAGPLRSRVLKGKKMQRDLRFNDSMAGTQRNADAQAQRALWSEGAGSRQGSQAFAGAPGSTSDCG